jgi:multidrug resistance efflux pump
MSDPVAWKVKKLFNSECGPDPSRKGSALGLSKLRRPPRRVGYQALSKSANFSLARHHFGYRRLTTPIKTGREEMRGVSAINSSCWGLKGACSTMSPQNASVRRAGPPEQAAGQNRPNPHEDLGVREQINLLRQFEAESPKTETVRARLHKLSWENTGLRRTLKAAVALVAVAVLGWTPLQRLLSITSAEAIVNSRVITLRSPIEGQIIDWPKSSALGAPLRPNEPVLRIENRRADRSRLDDLRRRHRELIDQRQTTIDRTVEFEKLRDEQLTQYAAFTQGRIAQIEARRNEVIADTDAIKARLVVSETTLNRVTTLYGRGFQTQQALDEANRENKVLKSALTASERRLDATEIELASARKGIFVTDGFNDVPRSAQRASELSQLIAELKVALVDQDRRLKTMKSEIEEETRRYEAVSVAVMTSPTQGQVWEVLTSPGEDVHRGQDLMRVLDCKQAVVTTAVSEANFNKLTIGSKAAFRFRGESKDHSGTVIGLYGLASVPANLAINQSTLAREPYHVTVEIPDLATGSTCLIGRTGIVTFDAGAAPQ